MDRRRAKFWIGLIALLAGGAVLGWSGGRTGTVLGTTLGLAGVILIGWAWAGPSDEAEGEAEDEAEEP